MFGFFKNLIRKSSAESAGEPPSAEDQSAPTLPDADMSSGPQAEYPAAAFRATALRRNLPAQNGKGIEVPLQAILAGLPMELQPRVRQTDVGDAAISVPLERVLAQLSRGAVRISFGELRQAAPDVFTAQNDRDRVLVCLPLAEILSRLNPALITRRRVQRQIEVPEEIRSPFDDRGEGLVFSVGPSKPVAAVPPAHAAPRHVTPAAPVAPPPSRTHLAAVPNQPRPTPPMPAAPPRPAPPMPTAPPRLSPASAPAASAPAAFVPPTPLIPTKPISFNPTPAPVPVPAPRAMPRPKVVVAPVAAPKPPPPAPIAPVSTEPAASDFHGDSSSRAPEPVAEPVTSQPQGEPLLVDLSAAAEGWPEAVRKEIMQLHAAESGIALPMEAVEQALRLGRIAFSWKTVRGWIQPALQPSPSAHDGTVLELPLRVVAPIFLARKRESAVPLPKVAVDEDIPNLFFGFPQPENGTPVAQATARPADTNYYVWGDSSDTAQIHESEVRRGPSPGTKFVAKYATPNEVVSRAASLDGVAGALIALPDGLLVANRLPPELNAETLAAFLPQIFGKVSQCTKELRMGELNNLNFTVGNVPWKIFRVNAIFFAAFGRTGEPLPTAQLAALAAELDHKPK